jgi:hypothetical protein
MTLDWMIGVDDEWCRFDAIDLDSPCFQNLHGVYIIWFGPDDKGHEGRVVKVGYGHIHNKLAAEREDPVLTRYTCRGLLVTWAEVDLAHRASVEAYLNGVLNPLINDPHPSPVQTLVNLPPW